MASLKKNKKSTIEGYELDEELELMLATNIETRRIGVLLLSVLIMIFIAVVIL